MRRQTAVRRRQKRNNQLDKQPMEPEQTSLQTPLVVQRQNPKWVGLIMALFLPGSAHFLSGQRQTGVLIYFALFLIHISLFLLGIPGVGVFYGAVGLFILCTLFFVGVLISSWRPTRRLGCFGWLLFIGVWLFQVFAINDPLASFMKTYVVEGYAMNGAAMKPTLIAPSVVAPEVLRQDRIVVNKWLYRQRDPKRGDIAIFKMTNPYDGTSATMTSRVVGLPGETVDIESPYVLINGERLTDPPIFARIASQQDGFSGYYTAQELAGEGAGVPLPLTLGLDEYFMMGDNSPYSFDSRFWGPVRRQDITGKIIRIFYPFDRIREVE